MKRWKEGKRNLNDNVFIYLTILISQILVCMSIGPLMNAYDIMFKLHKFNEHYFVVFNYNKLMFSPGQLKYQ